MSEPVIYWFRNNLRLTDNPSLVQALRSGKPVVPVYVFDERNDGQHELGFKLLGPYRRKFLIESIKALKESLAELGVHLHIRQGNVVEEILRLVRSYEAEELYGCQETTTYEIDDEETLSEEVQLHLSFDQFLVEPDKLHFRTEETPEVFGRYRRKLEKQLVIRELATTPAWKSTMVIGAEDDMALNFPEVTIDERSAYPFRGGMESAWERIRYYLDESRKVSWYKKTRNGLIGTDYSTKFSAFLALGCVSPVEVFHALKTYEAEHGANESTYWVFFEMLWRDYFKLISLKHGSEIFSRGGIQEKRIKALKDRQVFEAWRTGQTRDDFVNANMKELLATGFMSNRGRQNVASYLVHDLKIDWRWGAAWMESQLIDYDCSSNWVNWMYVAGVGNNTRNKKFDTRWQAERYDPNGRYQRIWNTLF